jgi:hypothetical protein
VKAFTLKWCRVRGVYEFRTEESTKYACLRNEAFPSGEIFQPGMGSFFEFAH